jgi:hypothetical protein
MRYYTVDLNISREEWLKIYRGVARKVHCQALDGTRILLPAHHFYSFVSHNGISGRFALEIDENQKLHTIKRVNF